MQGPSKINPSQMEIGDTFKIKNIMFGTEFSATLRGASPQDGLTFEHVGGIQSTIISFLDTHDYEFYPTGLTIARLAKVEAERSAKPTAVQEPEIKESTIALGDIKEGQVIKVLQHNGKESIGISKINAIDDDIHIQVESGIHRYIPRLYIKNVYLLTLAAEPQEAQGMDATEQEEAKILIGDINYLREQDKVEVHDSGQIYEGVVDSISMHTLCVHADTNVYIYFDSSDDNIEIYLVGDESTQDSSITTEDASMTTGTTGTKNDVNVGDVVEVWYDNKPTSSCGVVGLNQIDDDLRIDTENGVLYIDWARVQKVQVQSSASEVIVTEASIEFFELFEQYLELPAASVKLAEIIHDKMQGLATTVDLIQALNFAVSTRNTTVTEAIAAIDEKPRLEHTGVGV